MSIPHDFNLLGGCSISIPVGWKLLSQVTFAPNTYLITPYKLNHVIKTTSVVNLTNLYDAGITAGLTLFCTLGEDTKQRIVCPTFWPLSNNKNTRDVYCTALGLVPPQAYRNRFIRGEMHVTSYANGTVSSTTVNGITVLSNFTYLPSLDGQDTYLGGSPRTGGTDVSWIFKKLIVETLTGVKLAYFVPVKNGNDIRIYDAISKQFCTLLNGQLLDYPELPAGYIRCEYLQSTGTLYIDTGIVGDLNTSVDIVASNLIKKDTSKNEALFGSRIAVGRSIMMCFSTDLIVDYESSKNRLQINDYNTSNTYELSIHPYEAKSIIKDINTNTSVELSLPLTNFTTPGTLYIFNINQPDFEEALWKLYNTTNARVHSLTICDSDNYPLLNFIPALDKNCRPCMYDTVSKQPFYNKGTGEFLYKIK